MGRIFYGGALLVLAFASYGAQAKETATVWEGCGENKVSGLNKFMVGPTAARYFTPQASAQQGIDRCTQALTMLAPDASWQRKAALLRSRAKFYVMGKKHREALADLDAIAAMEQPDTIYARSFAVSVRMLRAVAYLEAGKRPEAAAEAIAAMRLRPWSERLGQFAYAVSGLRDEIPAGEGANWNQLILLDNAFSERRAEVLARAGDWQEALADWQRARPVPGDIGQTFVQLPNVSVQGAPGFPVRGVDVKRTSTAAIAAAMAGRADLADSWLAALDKNMALPVELDPFVKRFGTPSDPEAQQTERGRWAGLVAAAKLAGAGDVEGAARKIESLSGFPINQTVIGLVRSVLARLPQGSQSGLRETWAKVEEQLLLDRNERYVQKFDPTELLSDLPDHEEVMLANGYQSTVRFIKANGFSTKVAPDGKTAQVSFFGNKSQPFAIGEMTLLRAAELAIERGARAFRVVSSNDYKQTTTMTMYGSPIGPSHVSGNSTEMTIEFVAPDAPQAIDAAAVRAALGPIYIKDEPRKKS